MDDAAHTHTHTHTIAVFPRKNADLEIKQASGDVHTGCRATPQRTAFGMNRAALTGKHDTLVRRATGWQGAPDGQQAKKLVSILPVYQQMDWGPGMVKCVGPTRYLMRPWV